MDTLEMSKPEQWTPCNQAYFLNPVTDKKEGWIEQENPFGPESIRNVSEIQLECWAEECNTTMRKKKKKKKKRWIFDQTKHESNVPVPKLKAELIAREL